MVEISEEVSRQEKRREENWSSQANLEDGRSQTERDKGLTEYAGTDTISHTSNRAHSTNDVTRQNARDENKARKASTDMSIRRSRVESGLINHA